MILSLWLSPDTWFLVATSSRIRNKTDYSSPFGHRMKEERTKKEGRKRKNQYAEEWVKISK